MIEQHPLPVLSKNLNLQIQVATEQNIASKICYGESLIAIAANISAIAEKQDLLNEVGGEIINQFNIEPSLFDNPARTIVFTCIADRWNQNKSCEGEAAQKEQDFLLDSLTLLAFDHSTQFAKYKLDIECPVVANEVRKQEVYKKYTNVQVTKELSEAINGGLLSDVKERLGITADNEDPFTLRVLSIDPKDQTTFGLTSPLMPSYEDIPGDRHEKSRVIASNIVESKTVKQWKKGLAQRSLDMAAELGLEDSFGAAWVTTVNNVKTLCLAQGTAEKILHPEITVNLKGYSKEDHGREIAILEHEYTHTQGGVNLDQNILFGINAEEVRAEHFSGNRMGYQDVKGFYQDLQTI